MPKYKSKLEQNFARSFPQTSYEPTRLSYEQTRHYTPDFKFSDTLYVETKGLFTGADRTKHKLIRQKYPNITIILVFENPQRKLSKKSTTSYADYCDKQGWPWSDANPINVQKAIDAAS